MRRLRLTAILIGLLTFAGRAAFGQCQYEVTAIIEGPDCPAPFGNDRPVGVSINEHGAWAGYLASCFGGHDRAVFWSPGQGFQTPTLPGAFFSRATDITNDGRVVGWQETMEDGDVIGQRAFIIDDGVYTRIDPLPGGNKTEAAAINEAGRVVGTWGNISTGPIRAFYWDGDGPLTDLGPLLGTTSSHALDVNRDGDITGWVGVTDLSSIRAFVIRDGAVNQLPPIPSGITSQGEAMNNLGQVVGKGFTKLGDEFLWEAFLWDGRAFTVLGTLPGTVRSTARDINDASQIVGWCEISPGGSTVPFLWQQGSMYNLNQLVDQQGVELKIPHSINNRGDIACAGLFNGGAAMFVLSISDRREADLNHDCVVNVFDLLLLLREWSQTDSIADADGDGVVGFPDLLVLLNQWGG